MTQGSARLARRANFLYSPSRRFTVHRDSVLLTSLRSHDHHSPAALRRQQLAAVLRVGHLHQQPPLC
ncbi:MAG: hypothetical protein EBZ51_10400, partial [Synechococcaceae bacterium WB9_2_112]|nr:hypothetical protein [Synechococcaceae bacterium WB9_2_112]